MVQYWKYAWGNALPPDSVQLPQEEAKLTDSMEVDGDESVVVDSATGLYGYVPTQLKLTRL